jgi:ketosteroid isomerase-like protein
VSALEVVAELVRRFQAGDVDGAFALYDPAVRIEQPASLPHGGVHEGHEGVRAMAGAFARHWSRDIAGARLLDAGGTAVQVTTQTWTAVATGRAETVEVVELFAVAGGLVTAIGVFPQDTARLLATLEAS